MRQSPVLGHDRVLHVREHILLFLVSFVLFGYSMIGGRPLTMHEAVLPQSACEMLADRDWVIPKSGGRPWLERPPLPQWITVATATATGTCAREWAVRLPSTVIATGIVVLLARMSATWFGHTVGFLSGLLLATMFEFTRYAWLAEADIFLCGIVTAAVAVFVRLEFFQPASRDPFHRFWGARPVLVLLFFVLLGLTNLAKGLGFGTIMVLAPVVGFVLWNRDRTQLARYLWSWGWLVFLAIAGAWPLAAWLRYPDVLELWWFDLGGRLSGSYTAINQPLWYYPVTLSWATQPWTIPALIALTVTKERAFTVPSSPERFLWCWLFFPVIAFSLASGKHHHYLVQCLAPWAILGALGLVWLGDRIALVPSWKRATVLGCCLLGLLGPPTLWWLSHRLEEPAWMAWALIVSWMAVFAALAWVVSRGNLRWAMAILLGVILPIYAFGYTYAARISDQSLADTIFLKEVPTNIQPPATLVVNADLGSLDVFRILFYLHDVGNQVVPIHNLSYLMDERFKDESIYLVSRQKDLPILKRYGIAEVLLRSAYTRRETSPQDRLTLFRLTFHKDVSRYPAPRHISPMQAMAREQGPYLGTRF